MESEVLYNVIDKTKLKKNESERKEEADESPKSQVKKSILNLKKPKALYIYDFVKVKVTLNEHFYVLSRHMISRMLMLCRVA